MTPEQAEELRRQAEELAAVADGEAALIPQGVSAEEARLELAKKTEETERAILEMQEVTERMATELQREVEEQRQEMARRVDAAKVEMATKMREMKEMMAPLERQMAQLKEGIWTVNLYLGTDEQLYQLAEGAPAAAEEHVRVRQLVLAMDQEAAVAAEEGGIDSFDIEKFDDWLLEDWAHVEQVIPEVKGVVALVPRWDPKTHWASWELEDPEKPTGAMVRKVDAHATASAEANNRVTYFLIRNGRQLYRIAMGDFYAGDKLMPSRQEWESFFEETNPKTGLTSKLIPGTPEWEKAEEAAGSRRRHYMRVGLILQGLADRTEVFKPVPAEGVLDFLADNEFIDFVMDADNLLGPARLPFREWQKAVNREMRPGERIVASFESEGFRAHEYKLAHRYNETAHGRIYPATIEERPETGRPYEIKGRKGKGLYFNFPRISRKENNSYWLHARRWRNASEAERKTMEEPQRYLEKTVAATCTIYPEDTWVIAYDRVDVDEVRYYLDSRLERHHYVEMFPVLKAILRAKELEAEEEQPYRDYLPAALAREAGVTEERAREEIDDLLSWYKFEHRRHRPVSEDDEKATKQIIAEFKRRIRGESEPMDETLLALLEEEYPDHLIIGRKRNGRYFAVVPEDEEPFVRVVDHYASGKVAEDLRWQLIGHRADRWRVAIEGERWASWDLDAMSQEYISPPERLAITGMLRYAHGEDLIGVRFDRERRLFSIWFVGGEGHLPERVATAEIEDAKIEEYEEEGWGRVGGPHGYATLKTGYLLNRARSRYKYGASSKVVKPGTPPWRETYAGFASNAAERRDRERALKSKNERIESEMLYVNERRLEALYARQKAVQDLQAVSRRISALARSYAAQIARRWERDQMEAIREAFWKKHGDAAHHLWPTYVRNQVKTPKWPYDNHRSYYHYTSVYADQDLTGALEAVLEMNLDPIGLTVAQVADLARWLLYIKPDPDARSYYRRDPDQWAWEVPEDVAGYVFEPLAEEDTDAEGDDEELGEDPNDELDDDQAEAEEYEEEEEEE